MFDVDAIENRLNEYSQQFAEIAEDQLGEYVYILSKPNFKPFYVGKGTGDRVVAHQREALKALKSGAKPTNKTKEILEAWKTGAQIEWAIVARNLADAKTAEIIEGAIIHFSKMIGYELTNQQGGAHGLMHGLVGARTLSELAAKPVNPQRHYKNVFLFNISNTLEQPIQTSEGIKRSAYDATRSCWTFSEKYRNLQPAIALGLVNGVAQAAFSIKNWWRVPGTNKWEFVGEPIEATDLVGFRFSKLLKIVGSQWLRGNPVVVEFDGRGGVKVLRGKGPSNDFFALT